MAAPARGFIAIAMLHRSDLIIADGPTALDVIQAQILSSKSSPCLTQPQITVTHDLSVVADDMAVMYAGRIVETRQGRRRAGPPRHPRWYSRRLPSNQRGACARFPA